MLRNCEGVPVEAGEISPVEGGEGVLHDAQEPVQVTDHEIFLINILLNICPLILHVQFGTETGPDKDTISIIGYR